MDKKISLTRLASLIASIGPNQKINPNDFQRFLEDTVWEVNDSPQEILQQWCLLLEKVRDTPSKDHDEMAVKELIKFGFAENEVIPAVAIASSFRKASVIEMKKDFRENSIPQEILGNDYSQFDYPGLTEKFFVENSTEKNSPIEPEEVNQGLTELRRVLKPAFDFIVANNKIVAVVIAAILLISITLASVSQKNGVQLNMGVFTSTRSDQQEIYRLEGSNAVRITNSPGNSGAWDPFVSQIGKLYFTSNRDGKQEIYRLDDSQVVRVTYSPGDSEAWDPIISLSGNLYYTSNRDGKRDIYRLEGSDSVRVTNSPGNSEAWEPFVAQSGKLYFTSNRDGKREIYRLDGSDVVRSTYSPGDSEAWDPYISLTGKLYFSSNRDGKREIYRLDGSEVVRATYSPGNSEAWDPSIASSGNLTFTSNRDGKREIYRLEGSNAVRITHSPGKSEAWDLAN